MNPLACVAFCLVAASLTAQRPEVLLPEKWLPPPRSVAPSGNYGPSSTGRCLKRTDVFLYEDSTRVLMTNYSTAQLTAFMAKMANAVIQKHGDNFDFIGWWTNFAPRRRFGTAFYGRVANDVRGIGDVSCIGRPIFDYKPTLGINSKRLEGFIGMWLITDPVWQPGTGSNASFTRLALAQEFEHRFSLFLPPLKDGRLMQGGVGCPRSRIYHWNWRIDGQGSGMELSEWVGANPALLRGSFVSFNTDIKGGVFAYTDLYLMGYVSPAEMDAGNSELRYMDTANCGGPYNGNISTFSSKDIIAAAGPRIPDSTKSQKHYRTAWVMVYLRERRPTNAELDKAIAIHEQHERDWHYSTLGRGTMDNSLSGRCGNARVYGCGVNPIGSLQTFTGVPAIGTTMTVGVHNPLQTQRWGSPTMLFLGLTPDPAFPCGTRIAGFGMRGRNAPGELLLSAPGIFLIAVGPRWWGGPASYGIVFPNDPRLIGARLFTQGLIVDPGNPGGVVFGLTDGAQLTVGL